MVMGVEVVLEVVLFIVNINIIQANYRNCPSVLYKSLGQVNVRRDCNPPNIA